MYDKDNIRVDLLKFRRKAYLSYQENSVERKKFLKTILENELRLTEKEVPHDLVNFLLEEDNLAFQNASRNVVLCFLAFVCSTAAAFMVYPMFHGVVSSIFVGASIGCLWAAFQYGHDYWKYRKSVTTVKEYFDDMRQYMNRISNDIKRLEGPQ